MVYFTLYRLLNVYGCRLVTQNWHHFRRERWPKHLLGNGLSAGVEFSDQLLARENSARDRYAKISESLTFKKNPGWLDQMLDHQISPTLHHIGFDAPVAKVIFKIASSSWQLMGPLSEKIVGFHPLIHQQVEEVRQGLELKFCKTGSSLSLLFSEYSQSLSL